LLALHQDSNLCASYTLLRSVVFQAVATIEVVSIALGEISLRAMWLDLYRPSTKGGHALL
jgi:hypothetical protein